MRCATRTPRRALVSVAGLIEAGWSPQQLAAEVVDDLRQAFLLSLAPELASTSGTERERLRAQAERLGLARLVRAMESLGLAQVDMREAPDARVVLEVTLVRLARSELDSAPDALAERVSRLERALASPGRVRRERHRVRSTVGTDVGSGTHPRRLARRAIRARSRPSAP